MWSLGEGAGVSDERHFIEGFRRAGYDIHFLIPEPPDGALGKMFLAADRLAKNPFDAKARRSLLELHGQIDARHPPYAFAPRTWSRAVDGVGEIVERITADATEADVVAGSELAGVQLDVRRDPG